MNLFSTHAFATSWLDPSDLKNDNYEISQNLAERVLLPAACQATADTILVMNGFSFRGQIKQITDLRALHFAEVLAGEMV